MAKESHSRLTDQFKILHVAREQRGQTLAAALRALVPDCSWGQARQWIQGRHLQVNGNLCLDIARRVTERDVLKLWREPLPKPVNHRDLRLIYVDEHLLIVEKPAGVTSVRHSEERKISGHRKQLQPTLEELLPFALARFLRIDWPAITNQGGKKQNRSGQRQRTSPTTKVPRELQVIPVHRLDRDTSGLMLFARTRQMESLLVNMFRKHAIKRYYWGVCLGELQSQTIRSQLVRDRGDGLRGSSTPTTDADSQEAVTHVTAVEQLPGYTIVNCELETGRTHQIRIHLSEQGHMLCGEKVYTRGRDGKAVTDTSQAPRHALHSDRLAFVHPLTGQELSFRMKLPVDLAHWLDRLRQRIAQNPSDEQHAPS